MTAIAIACVIIGCAVGYVMARRYMVRLLVALILALIAAFLFVLNAPHDALPGDGYAAVVVSLLMAPPMVSGLIGGAIVAWLANRHAKVS
ncbi:hypothetical protein [uncultured Tateyamaria sp.]|uniref:hypothetical protein n=1 Tax=uncultured Tateyamaria sp. TaxID=455651 RepID=UPI0026398202|nr:hypothetical protein [uncultured Tateyamaria sp.]